MGKSNGARDGDVLVVTTKWQNGESWLDRAGNFATNQLTVTERFTLVGLSHISYQGHRRRLPGKRRIASRQFAGASFSRRPAHGSRRFGILDDRSEEVKVGCWRCWRGGVEGRRCG
jgi:hypothetical protein